MNYKLAKKLKDAGFRIPPSTDRDGYTLTENGDVKKDRYIYETESWKFKGEHCFIPTLSELIEACDYSTDSRLEFHRSNTKKCWYAIIKSDKDQSITEIQKNDKSLKVAIAKLWLKLNK